MKKKLIRFIFTPTIFLLISITLTLLFFFNSDINPNIFSFNHQNYTLQHIEKGIRGVFTAQDNYLGIVKVRLKRSESLSGNSIFRIKESKSKEWLSVSNIDASQYNTIPFYSFGLPPIQNSKGKVYIFEITLNKKNSQKLQLDKQYPVLASQYQYPKNLLLSDKKIFLSFMWGKITYYGLNANFLKIIIVYNIPLLLYFAYVAFGSKLISEKFKSKVGKYVSHLLKPYILLIALGIFIDVFVIRKYSDYTTILFTLLWIFAIAAYKFESRYSFAIALVFLTFCPFILSANMDFVAEKSAIWAYMFLVVGIFHSITEVKEGESTRFHNLLTKISALFLPIRFIDKILVLLWKRAIAFAFFSIKNFIKFIAFVVIALAVTTFSLYTYLQIIDHTNRVSLNPVIKLAEPPLVYPGAKVLLYGNALGDNSMRQYALIKDGSKIRADYWDETKVIFTIPLDWSFGQHSFWLEKPVNWHGNITLEKSNKVIIKILNPIGPNNSQDDLYFKQIDTWTQETRDLNGY